MNPVILELHFSDINKRKKLLILASDWKLKIWQEQQDIGHLIFSQTYVVVFLINPNAHL